MITIRRAVEKDFDDIWPIFQEVAQRGDTYVFPTDIPKEEAYPQWFASYINTYVALVDDQICGTYIIKPNQIGLGSHVANGSYMVDDSIRNRGVGRAMCEHSILEARELGFKAMQFNMVISTNERAVALWKKFGFEIVGTLPKAFQHKEKGLVDVYVMYKWLDD